MANVVILTLLMVLPFVGDTGSSPRNPPAPDAVPSHRAIKDLLAEGPDPGMRDKLMLFGQFVGDWKIDEEFFDPKSGSKASGKGYAHFGWILYGTAVQDVWEGESVHPKHFGTTVRVYDPKTDTWNCVWISPPDRIFQRLTGRKVGDEIVLETRTLEGDFPERWIFSEITPRSFHWHSEESHDGGKTWILTEDTRAQRISPEP